MDKCVYMCDAGDEISPPDGDPYEAYRILFDLTFFFFVIVILLAIIQGKSFDDFHPPLPSIRQSLSYDDRLEDEREDYRNCSVLYCVTQLS